MSQAVLSEKFRLATEALDSVRNIFCVGRNYRDHAVELGNAVPERPLIFGKPTHALTPAAGALVLPPYRTNIHHEIEIVLYMKTEHTPGTPVEQSVGGVALGLDLTDRDAQNALKAAGQPWEYAKGFRNSAVITDFYTVEDWKGLVDQEFSLRINNNVVQSGTAADMLFPFAQLLDYVSLHFRLTKDDIVFTGTPAGVGKVSNGDVLELRFGEKVMGNCSVVLE